MASKIAIANHKGGCGKTATAQALSKTLADDHRQRVLLVDMDPQSSLTEACGVKVLERDKTMADVMGGSKPGKVRISQVIKPLDENLALAPATLDMAVCELGLAGRLLGREAVLRQALQSVEEQYDIVIIDCPPSLGLLTVNALIAATWIIIPTQAKVQDLRGLRLFLETLEQVKVSNPDLQERILVTFYKGFRANKRSLAALQEGGLPVFKTLIGDSIRVAEGPEFSKSILEYAPHNPRSNEYREFGREVLEWLHQS
ncbi:MAG: ParA family protein [Chloroflexi bacterium]|nr:ParA family protein [Chloroflexota bacterium]